MVADDLFKLAIAEGIAGGILGLNNSVGVKQEAVAGIERNLTNRIVGIRSYSNQQAVAFNPLKLALPPTQEWWMARRRVRRLPGLRIKPQIGRGNELASQLAGEDTIQTAEHFRRVEMRRTPPIASPP